MESLEVELRRIEALQGDLSAEIVLKEEVGHWEFFDPHVGGYCETQDSSGNCHCRPADDYWIVDEHAITEPDISKREAAKAALEQVHKSSGWYAARYVSGKCLEMNDTENLGRWVTEIAGNFKAQARSEQRILQALDDALQLVDLTSDERIGHLLEEVYETGSSKAVRVKAGVEMLKRRNHQWRKYDWERYTYLLPIQAQVYARELSLGSDLDSAELEIVFCDGPTSAARKRAGALLGKKQIDILGNELFYQRVHDQFHIRHDWDKAQLNRIYEGASERRFREVAAKELGYSKTKFLEDEVERGHSLSLARKEHWATESDIMDVFYHGEKPENIREAGRILHYEEVSVLGRLMKIGQPLKRDALMSVYNSSGSRACMHEAGRLLGYSRLRIGLHTLLRPGLGI